MDAGETRPMLIEFKRPKWLKRSRSSLIDDRSLKAAKRSKASFLNPRGLKNGSVSDGEVDAAFKAEVDDLIRENAELLQRLAR
jgi:hypothetical protein